MSVGTQTVAIKNLPFMVVNRDYLPVLGNHRLLNFDRLYHFQGATVIKQIRDRSVLRFEFNDGTKNRIFYLKRHADIRTGLWKMISSYLSGNRYSPGMSEFKNLCDFRKSGIPTATPVAAGERRTGFLRYESFLLTESFEPYISLEEIIYHHPEMLQGDEGKLCKEKLMKAVAKLARQMHDCGFNHRDFNATHVLVNRNSTGDISDLALFDLQRMDRKKWLRLKWFIKIMAELSYTMPDPLFNNQDRLLLFQTYKNISNLRMIDRLQWRWIQMKIERIRRHTDKIMKTRKQAAQRQ